MSSLFHHVRGMARYISPGLALYLRPVLIQVRPVLGSGLGLGFVDDTGFHDAIFMDELHIEPLSVLKSAAGSMKTAIYDRLLRVSDLLNWIAGRFAAW
jgi:hypothetical protein